MVKTKLLQIRLSANEYERIRNNTHAKGYSTIASYLRAVALEKDLFTETKIAEIHQMMKQILEKNTPSGKNPKK